jgi:FHS family L-fucose permease-like MFS transporter
MMKDRNETSEFVSNKGSRDGVFPTTYRLSFFLVTLLFFIWGMSNNLTDILVQQFKKSFELSPLQAQLVQTAVFLGYFLMALPAATLMRRWGYKAGILAGLCLFSIGAFLFWPAAVIGQYWLMLVALFIVGCGSATLETAANPFISQSGPQKTSERRLNFSQAFNPPGTIAGVLLGTIFIFSAIEYSPARIAEMKTAGTYPAQMHVELLRVVPTYLTLSCIVLLLAAVISFVPFPEHSREIVTGKTRPLVGEMISLLRITHLREAVFAQFFYCGAQVCTWSAFIPYVKQYTLLTERSAGLLLTGNLVSFAAGRVVSLALMRWISPIRLMTIYAFINIGLITISVAAPGPVGVMALLTSSFCMSIMFPTIFASGIKDLGPRTKLAGSLLVMSIIGAAIFPPLLGLLARHFDSYAKGYTVIVPCYFIVAFFGYHSNSDKKLKFNNV